VKPVLLAGEHAFFERGKRKPDLGLEKAKLDFPFHLRLLLDFIQAFKVYTPPRSQVKL